MGLRQSKDELLYHQVNYGNVEGIKALRREGAGLEWLDKEGKTPLIAACLVSDSFLVAKTLIELGANINAYRPGSHAGTPLHHAAKRGLEETVKLLLSYGAHATRMNDDCQTPLDLARAKGHTKVVRAIESHICRFSGWLRELCGPGFLEAFAPQWMSRKIWAVVLPCEVRNTRIPPKFELAIYSGLEIAQPRVVIQLWKTKVQEPDYKQQDPVVVIFDNQSNTKFKFLSVNEGDKQQVQRFYNACIGLCQLNSSIEPSILAASSAAATVSSAEDMELAMALSASLQTAMEEQPSKGFKSSNMNGWAGGQDSSSRHGWKNQPGLPPSSKASSSGWIDDTPAKSNNYNGWGALAVATGSNSSDHQQMQSSSVAAQSNPAAPVPSAPPVPDDLSYDGPISYPKIDLRSVNVGQVAIKALQVGFEKGDSDDSGSLCAICLDAPREGACVPCGHVVGCMACLNDIKSKDWGCPVCRVKLTQVIKLYTV